MDEILEDPVRQSVQWGVSPQVLRRPGRAADGVPAHVRHLQFAVALARMGQSSDVALEEPQALVDSEFVTLAHQELLPQADAEQRRTPRDHFAQHRDQVEAVQRGHRIAEGADARQQHPVCGQHRDLVAGDRRLKPGVLTGVLDAEQVAQAVIDDGYLGRWLRR